MIIDGSGWAFHLLNAPALGDAVERHHGGDYQELDARVEAAIGELRAARLVPEVWWDGPRTRMKARTMRKRMIGRLEEERRLFQYCVDGATDVDEASLPPPPLFTQSIKDALRRLEGCSLCEFEGSRNGGGKCGLGVHCVRLR